MNDTRDWSELEDEIADAIHDSMDMDWTSRTGAKAVVELLNKLRPIEGPDFRALLRRVIGATMVAAVQDETLKAGTSPAVATAAEDAIMAAAIALGYGDDEGLMRLIRETQAELKA